MNERDREALNDIIGVLDRALGFPISSFQVLDSGVTVVSWAIQNLMRACSLPVESESQLFQSFHDVAIPVSGQPTHLGIHRHGLTPGHQ